jgi:hypothetical protein
MREALDSSDLFGRVFAGESWAKWRVWLIALMGEELTDEERVVFTGITGRDREPLERVEEAWAICGRRSGKTRSAAVLAAYISALCDWRGILAPGERASLPVVSSTTKQATKAFGFVRGIFMNAPELKALVINETADTIGLSNGVDIEVQTASFRSIRSGTAVGFICDEVAFWRSEELSKNPDREILEAARPSLSTTGGLLLAISSPYAMQGELWNTYKRDFGPDGDPLILVAKAASRVMNPTLPQKVVDRAYAKDAAWAAAEYGAEFRSDVAGFVDLAVVESAVSRGVAVRPALSGVTFSAFCDPSGGKSDAMTLAIGHREDERLVLDLILERKPPFSPESVVDEFAQTMKAYRVSKVRGDRFGGEWPAERFRKCGVIYEVATKPKSDIYCDFLPLINSGRVDLLDNARLIAQLAGLERRTARGGKDSIDHPRGQHDDLSNAAAGVLTMVGDGAWGPIRINPEFVAQMARAAQMRAYRVL